MPALGRCSIISTGIGGSVTSKAIIKSEMADSITASCSSGIERFPQRLLYFTRINYPPDAQKTTETYCHIDVRQTAQASSAPRLASHVGRSGPQPRRRG